jgi:hypothetical protein
LAATSKSHRSIPSEAFLNKTQGRAHELAGFHEYVNKCMIDKFMQLTSFLHTPQLPRSNLARDFRSLRRKQANEKDKEN